MQWRVKSYRCMMQRESNLTAAWCSGESIWQRGVKSKNSGRLPRPLKGQSCKKNHIWGTFNILVLWESFIKGPPTYNLFLTPRCIMQWGVKLQIRITLRIWNQIWKNLGYESGPKMDTFDEKNQSCKISRCCTFKVNPLGTIFSLYPPPSYNIYI